MGKQIFSNDKPGKNLNGELGPVCNYCGGYGFTNSINGQSSGCSRCQGDGIEPISIRELEAQVKKITLLLGDVCRALEQNKILIQPE